MFMVSLHSTIALLVKVVGEAEKAAAAAAALIAAAESGAMRRMLVRERMWRRHCESESEVGCSSSSGGVGGSFLTAAVVSCSSGSSAFVNSIRHQNNVEEVFTRWTIFYNIISFL